MMDMVIDMKQVSLLAIVLIGALLGTLWLVLGGDGMWVHHMYWIGPWYVALLGIPIGLVLVWVLLGGVTRTQATDESAIRLLKQRLAAGEITEEEYDNIRRVLKSKS